MTLSPTQQAVLDCYNEGERDGITRGRKDISSNTGLKGATVARALDQLRRSGLIEPRPPGDNGRGKKPAEFKRTSAIPSPDLPLADLIQRRIDEFGRTKRYTDSMNEVEIKVTIDGPVGIAHFGDPHIDDPGCDIGLLQRHMQVCNDTPGMMAGNVGDAQNNWCQRLSHLFGKQETRHRDAIRLVEWMLAETPWLYLVGGNHDAWSGASDPLEWLTLQSNIEIAHFRYDGLRICLVFPNGKRVRINARHDFKGSSIHNAAHGLMSAAKKRSDHIFTCGHRHHSGHGVVKTQTGVIAHCHRVCSYKVIDDHAHRGGYDDEWISPCPVTIIDPQYEDDDPRLITSILDPEMAADVLTGMRAKAAA